MVRYYSKILHATWLGWAVAGGVSWLGPLLAMFHSVGMALLIGCVTIIDLRILGVGKALPIKPLQRLLPWGALGFALTLVSGIGFYASNPEPYQSLGFLLKMLCIVFAGINGLLFYTSGLYRRVTPIGANEDAPPAAKLSAIASISLWFAVLYWGRVLAFLNDAF